jgi:DNA-binding MarR family transcriptional regulator
MAESSVFETVHESLPKSAYHRRAWLEMVRCFSSIERVLMRHFAQEFNSSLPRYDVLTALALASGGLTMSELATTLMVTKGNITGVVRRLKEDGLVKKVTSRADRRIQSVTISAKGRRLWDRMHDDYDSIISEILSGQTNKELKSLTDTLSKTRKAVEKISATFESS